MGTRDRSHSSCWRGLLLSSWCGSSRRPAWPPYWRSYAELDTKGKPGFEQRRSVSSRISSGSPKFGSYSVASSSSSVLLLPRLLQVGRRSRCKEKGIFRLEFETNKSFGLRSSSSSSSSSSPRGGGGGGDDERRHAAACEPAPRRMRMWLVRRRQSLALSGAAPRPCRPSRSPAPGHWCHGVLSRLGSESRPSGRTLCHVDLFTGEG
jgi:hypothetical protein